ncbi:MAG: UPF0262 family protein [Mesorhizobium sp.]|uniref:UPF0262 family protein n=1 Tax=Mesorhizobium sp. TaxID=1871066 RepID=UPI001222D1D5|nr:UPF0262 family protein [Mesorhizobium sp.]TIN32337.1 MAG: UPF0262 family protein [Mesorhizobium sp.]TJU83570.1 MAG: UPF0262 family protein [Mesorhizobium sp.]
MGAANFRLCHVSLERSFGGTSGVRIGCEQAIAIGDLVESNTFSPTGHDGWPYRLSIALAFAHLALHIATEKGEHVVSHFLSLAPFRRLIKDYALMCESYYDAIAWARTGEAASDRNDSARDPRIHDDAAELLRERLSSKVSVDKDTARRLFTLVTPYVENAALEVR